MIVWDFQTSENPTGEGRPQGLPFLGVHDQIVIAGNPLEGAESFRLEAEFRQERGWEAEQRFVHIQVDGCADRVLLETRQGPAGTWYADTYVEVGGVSRILADPQALHRCGEWHQLTLICDGQTVRQFVNDRLEVSSPLKFAPLGPGRVSLGARLNRVSWFNGAIRKITFSRSDSR